MEVNNLLDVDTLVNQFLDEHKQGIATVHRTHFHNDNPVSIQAMIAEVMDELKTGCVSFLNKEDLQQDLGSYLFYIVNAFCQKRAFVSFKKKTEYLCPGCLFFKNKNTLTSGTLFNCKDCEDKIEQTTDQKKVALFKTFASHNKHGYRCADCERFIPHPLDNLMRVTCPYLDCCFVGNWSSLKRMNHPTIQSNPEKLILDATIDNSISMKNNIIDPDIDILNKIEVLQELNGKVILLKGVINSQMNSVAYSSSEFTVHNKLCCYQAFLELLDKYPIEMVDYLLHASRSGGFQQKIFQEYINILEKSLPYSFKKNGKIYKIESLLDDELSLFDGISEFDGVVSDKLEVKNNTKEFYIGGRKAAYTKPYYIGKLLSVYDKNTKESLINNVEEYGFSKLKMKDIIPGKEIVVTHLRIPPHYQMGGMVYVNRLRKKIVDRAAAMIDNT